MRLNVRSMGILLFILFGLVACSGPKVPHNGAFWSKNGQMVEINLSQVFPYAVVDTDQIINAEKPMLYLSFGQFL